jgi:carbon monoxide dehydrogenase subunit G
MTEFISNPVHINTPPQKIYTFLIDFNNFERLMPGQTGQWKSSTDSCSFTIQGMADLALIMGEKREYSLVKYDSAEPSPFGFSLQFSIEKESADSVVSCVLKADLSPMIKMMVSRPLQNLVMMLTEKLKQEMEAGLSNQ